MEIARSVYPTYGLDLSRMVLGENTPKYQPFINERFSTYNGEPFVPPGAAFCCHLFLPRTTQLQVVLTQCQSSSGPTANSLLLRHLYEAKGKGIGE